MPYVGLGTRLLLYFGQKLAYLDGISKKLADGIHILIIFKKVINWQMVGKNFHPGLPRYIAIFFIYRDVRYIAIFLWSYRDTNVHGIYGDRRKNRRR